MLTETPSLLSMHMFLAWAQWLGFYFALFWAYLPFAVAAFELNQLLARYV